MNLSTLHKISYGLYVVSSKKGEKLNGQIANTAFQITSDPATIAVSINKSNLTHEYIKESGVFSVSLLSEKTPLKMVGHFGFKSGRDLDKFEKYSYELGQTGCPIKLQDTLGYFEAEVVGSLDVGTHTIFVGQLVGAEVITDDAPMTYAFYHLLKKGLVKPT